MLKSITTSTARTIVYALVTGAAFMPMHVLAAATDADKAALQQATASCQAQVKEQARYNEMSLCQA
jgi:hypothetical protein